MHVEMSLDSSVDSADQDNHIKNKTPNPEDTQTISGSQVACSFGRMQEERQKVKNEGWERMALLSMTAVLVLSSIYVAIVLFV